MVKLVAYPVRREDFFRMEMGGLGAIRIAPASNVVMTHTRACLAPQRVQTVKSVPGPQPEYQC